MEIRRILARDNDQVRDIIQGVIMEYGAPKVGTAYSDAATQPISKLQRVFFCGER